MQPEFGSGLRKVVKSPRTEGSANWSPDGRFIACTVDYGDNWGVAVEKADGSDARRLPPGKLGGDEPSWSPDGTRLAYSNWWWPSGTYPPAHIFVCDADGSDRRQLTDGPDYDFWPEWTPDGQTILFSRGYGGAQPHEPAQLYLMNADGSGQRAHGPAWPMNMGLGWSPDGRKNAYLGHASE